MKLLTVTVPCYNSQEYMTKCINSLLQGGKRVEILIIDDGSTDKTGEIANNFAKQYPSIVKVIHQENGGHGEGINQGLKHATGLYFKTVDSDDWLSRDFPRFLDRLEDCEKQGGVDLAVTNYYYDHADGKNNRSIRFANALPAGRILSWGETKPFRIDEVLMIHACTFRTELLKKRGLSLPKHIFYEDNLFVYGNLPEVKRLYYLDIDLYHYFIGREGQSVQKEAVIRRYTHQLKATEEMFLSCHLDGITEARQQKYMKHEMFILFGIAVLSARLNRSDEADRNLEVMWEHCRAFDKKWADHFRKQTLLRFLCIRGKLGRGLARVVYHLAHLVVRFN